MTNARSSFASIACVLLLSAGCSGADPPYHELPLRDALTAEPEVIAAMPEEARKELAARFEDARRAQRDDETLPGDLAGAPATLIQIADDARAARGDDALVAASVREGDRARVMRPLSLTITGDPPPDLPPLAGGAGEATADLEARALRGPAGAVIGELLHGSGATRLVRVTAWPVGAAAAGDVVYVNASWLVALSPDDVRAVGLPPAPVLKTMSVGGNPYLTYRSLEACVATVDSRCSTCLKGGACDARATLKDFSDGKAECTFLSKDSVRTQELCALALLSIGPIADCMRNTPCPVLSVENVSTNLSEADGFLMSTACVQALDVCLGGTPTPSPTVDVQVKEPTCQDPFSSCASAFKGLGDACKSGSCSGHDQSCTSSSSCNSTSGSSNCSSCKSGSSSSSSSSCSSCKSGSSSSGSNNCKCEVQAAEEAPLGAIAWLLAPLAFVLTRARRPS